MIWNYNNHKNAKVYRWKIQVSQKFPEVPNCAQPYQEDDKQTHKLHSESSCKTDATQQEPQPPGSRKGPKNKNQNEAINFFFPTILKNATEEKYIFYFVTLFN